MAGGFYSRILHDGRSSLRLYEKTDHELIGRYYESCHYDDSRNDGNDEGRHKQHGVDYRSDRGGFRRHRYNEKQRQLTLVSINRAKVSGEGVSKEPYLNNLFFYLRRNQ